MTRGAVIRAVVPLVAALGLAGPGPADAARPKSAPARKAAAPPSSTGRPDAAVYQDARRAQAALEASRSLQQSPAEWERVAQRYRRVVARYPRSGYCDNALLAIGDLYRAMAGRFKRAAYADEALAAYRGLVEQYPSSRLGEQALYSVYEMARESGNAKRLAEAGKAYLATFPDSERAPAVKQQLRQRAPAQAAALPKAPPPGLAQVFDLRFWSGASSTRVVVDLEKKVEIKSDRIANPDRLWVDLIGARLHPNFEHRAFAVGDGLLEQIRIGQNRDDVVRIVLDFKEVWEHNVVYLENPTRLLIDVSGTPQRAVASAAPAPRASPPALPEKRLPALVADAASPTPTPPPPSPAPTPTPEVTASLPARRLTAQVAPDPEKPPPAPRKATLPIVLEGTDRGRKTAAALPSPPPAAPPAPVPPEANRAGSYSLARQLGLGARRIVIDAGHGGHDPGTIGRGGLQEKDLVLDVAVRLERMVRDGLGADVLMTRATDVFIPLEERTAIANAKGADLFLSIHANSSRNPTARGIETYFLNFAKSPHAEAVAARENAISPATLNDLQGLVKAITLNSKIDESRDFAASVQEALVSELKPRYPDVLDRGVHTAPFYVLIGANMPSVLAEIAFVSHPEEEKRLKAPEYREAIARSLLAGVKAYVEALNRTQTRQLTGPARRSTVETRGGRR